MWRISAAQLFNTVNGELVSCLGSNGNASETKANDRDRDFVLELRKKANFRFLGDCNHDVHKITHSAKSERFGLCGLSPI